MCLITSLKDSFITSKDIVVYKEVMYNTKGDLVTPYQNVPISEIMEPEDKAYFKINNNNKTIGPGFIHCYTQKKDVYGYTVIIPKGTECWISNDLQEICTKKIILCKNKEITPLMEILEDIVLPELKYNLDLPIICTNWYTATKYCKENNADLPSLKQLREIYKHQVYYNIKRIKKNLNIIYSKYYWSSTLFDSGRAQVLYFSNGDVYDYYFFDCYYVLAVLNF